MELLQIIEHIFTQQNEINVQETIQISIKYN
jgi:hypothetical protein